MKINILYILRYCYALSAVCVLLLASCSQSTEIEIEDVADKMLDQLGMTAKLEKTKPQTRSSSFPNNAKIGVVAISAAADKTNATATWSENIIINHLTADATDTSTGYSFSWSAGNTIDKFWPLKDQLLFLGYSPANLPTTESSNNVWRDSTTIQIKLPIANNDIPDILYADNPIANQSNFTVNFGTFCHVFSQVSVKVKGKDVSPAISLSQLSLVTSQQASYELPLQKMNVKEGDITYSLSGLPAVLTNNEFLLEATEDTPFCVFPDLSADDSYTKVVVQLIDKTHEDAPVTLTHTYSISQFIKPDSGSALLERGTRTTLVINIKGSTVGTGTETPQLTAESEQWSDKGDFGININ